MSKVKLDLWISRGLGWRKLQGLKVSVMTWFRLVEVEGWRLSAPALEV